MLAPQRLQVQAPAARADRGQELARLRRDQHKQRAPRRLLQRFQQRVGGVDVELVGAVDDHDAPRILAAGQAQKRSEPAHLVDEDAGCEALGALVVGPAQNEQARMRQRAHLTRRRGLRADLEAETRRIARLGLRQHMPRQAVGQRGLADALASGDQPGVVHAPAGEALRQLPLGLDMADEDTRLARMRKAFEAVGLGQRLGVLDRGRAGH
jgi:hypothetical protein